MLHMYCYVYCYVVVGLTRDIECYVVLLTCLQCYVVTQDYKVPVIIYFFLKYYYQCCYKSKYLCDIVDVECANKY